MLTIYMYQKKKKLKTNSVTHLHVHVPVYAISLTVYRCTTRFMGCQYLTQAVDVITATLSQP